MDLMPTPSSFSVRSAAVSFDTPGAGRVEVLRDLSFSTVAGEIVAVVGPSGCGKTTLLNVLSGQVKLDDGKIEWGTSLAQRPRIACLWQEDQSIPWRTALENIAFPLEIAGMARAERNAVATRWLNSVGLSGFENSYPSQLSGGMKKRVALAAALAAAPELLLLDEPLAALDHWTKQDVQQEILHQWERVKCTIVLVTHGADEAVALASRIVVMTHRPGRVFDIIENDLPRPRVLSELYVKESFHRRCREVWAKLKAAA
jgi:NitT/TauT family transport system ATP-binding protein